MSTVMEKAHEQKIEWFIIDAKDLVLGRVASQVAALLRGKHKTMFTPHLTGGTGVVIVNAASVKLTGNKEQKKKYFHHTGYPGGARLTTYADHFRKDATFPLRNAVSKMLPKNRLRSVMMARLKIYTGVEHPHGAQKLQEYTIEIKNR